MRIAIHVTEPKHVSAHTAHTAKAKRVEVLAIGDETFMRRQENVHLDGLVPAATMTGIAARLSEKLGPPVHEDEWVQVWRTRR